MRNVFSVAVVGLLASVSFANASTTNASSVATPGNYGIRYACEFEGRSSGDSFGRQDRDVRCRAEGVLEVMPSAASTGVGAANSSSGPIEIKCSNGYRLETERTAIAFEDDTLWINAERRDRLATIRVKDIGPNAQNESGKRFRADLLAADRVVIHAEGHCRFDFPHPGPSTVPSVAQ